MNELDLGFDFHVRATTINCDDLIIQVVSSPICGTSYMAVNILVSLIDQNLHQDGINFISEAKWL